MIPDDSSRDVVSTPDKAPTTPASDNSLSTSATRPKREELRQEPDKATVAKAAAGMQEAYDAWSAGRAASPSFDDLAGIAASTIGVTDARLIRAAAEALHNDELAEAEVPLMASFLVEFLLNTEILVAEERDSVLVARVLGFLAVQKASAQGLRAPAAAYYVARLLRVDLDPFQMEATGIRVLAAHPSDLKEMAAALIDAVRAAAQEKNDDELPAGEDEPEGLDVEEFFTSPDLIGESSYRAVHELLVDVQRSKEDHDGEPFTRDDAVSELECVRDHVRVMIAELEWNKCDGQEQPPFDFGSASPSDIREEGWRVLLHRDDRHDAIFDGRDHTVWVFQRFEDGKVIEVRGESDREALDDMRWQLAAMPRWSYTLPDGEPQTIRALDVQDAAVKILKDEGVSITPFSALEEAEAPPRTLQETFPVDRLVLVFPDRETWSDVLGYEVFEARVQGLGSERGNLRLTAVKTGFRFELDPECIRQAGDEVFVRPKDMDFTNEFVGTLHEPSAEGRHWQVADQNDDRYDIDLDQLSIPD